MADTRAGSETIESAKHAVGVAVAGALAAGLGGAARAMLQRRTKDHVDDEQEPTAADDAEADNEEPENEWEEPEEHDAHTDDAPPDRAPTSPEPRVRQNVKGASSSRVAQIVDRAREHVEALLGRPPESVSGLERLDGTWYVTLEIVELRRIPDSTDVLSSYEVVLDDDGNFIRLERRRRYSRAQVEEHG